MTLLSVNNLRATTNFKRNNEKNTAVKNNETITGIPLPGSKRLNYSPVAIGAINSFCWFSVGMLMDKLATKIFKSNVNKKFSLVINSAFALIMGAHAYKVAKNEAKQA